MYRKYKRCIDVYNKDFLLSNCTNKGTNRTEIYKKSARCFLPYQWISYVIPVDIGFYHKRKWYSNVAPLGSEEMFDI